MEPVKDTTDRIAAYVAALLKNRRPPRFPVETEDAGALRVAAQLSAARPGADTPSEEFVARLEQRLAKGAAEERASASLLTRRRLLGAAGVALASAVAGAAVENRVNQPNEPDQPTGDLVPHAGTWTPVARLASLPLGTPVRFSAGAVEGVVVNHGDRVVALSAICTHLGCVLNVNPTARRLDCPCHWAAFDLEGGPLVSEYTTPLRPLPRLRSRVRDGAVEVYTA